MTRRTTPIDQQTRPLTSMIDVVFLLLIFFICTMSFRVIEGRLDTQLPKSGGLSDAEFVELLEPLDIHLALDEQVPHGFSVSAWGRTISLSALPGLAARVRGESPETPARISTGPGITHGQVVAVVDAVLSGGIVTVTFAG